MAQNFNSVFFPQNKIDIHFMMTCLAVASLLGGVVVVFLPETSKVSRRNDSETK